MICINQYKLKNFIIHSVWHQFLTSPLHMKLCNVISVVHINQWSDSDIPFPSGTHSNTHAHTRTHMHIHKHVHTHSQLTCTHIHAFMYFNIRLTGVQQDNSENGHSKEKNDSKQNSTECSHNWCFSTLWTRPFGIWMGWSSLPDYPMPLAADELNRLL